MGHLQGINREQTAIMNLETMVPEEHLVRVIDRFVDICNLQKLGFYRVEAAKTGRPAYPAEMMIKLYIYGYENGIRSSRKLEQECNRNIEVMWLTNNLTPDHKTISDFRKHNIRPLQKLLREFVKLCNSWGLIGRSLIAVDGTKIKASNNKKMNFSRKKLDDRIKRLDDKINEFFAQIEENDKQDTEVKNDSLKELQNLLSRKEEYQGYLAELDATGENEKSLVAP